MGIDRLRRGGALLVLACLMLAACNAGNGGSQVTIKGKVFGEAVSLASSTPMPLAARVTCNGTATTAGADGAFSLTVAQAHQYTCVAAEDPQYSSVTATIPDDFGNLIDLNFQNPDQSTCTAFSGQGDVECGILKMHGGTVQGVVHYNIGGGIVSGGRVICANTGAAAAGVSSTYNWPFGHTDSQGHYTVQTARTGPVSCVAYAPTGDAELQTVNVTAGQTATANFQVCNQACHVVHYHGGPVMHSFNAYLIFWLPRGATFEPGGSDARFESLMQRYFRDIGGTLFYGLLAQYFDYQGAPQNAARLGGVWVDTTPYQHCGLNILHCTPARATRADPLSDDDIQGEVLRSFRANSGWQQGPTNEFFVFTAAGAEECQTGGNQADGCTFSDTQHSFCAYHSYFTAPAVTGDSATIYAYMPSAANENGRCNFPADFTGPNHDNIADATLDSVSHEQFESVSDPDASSGWFDDSSSLKREGEIGDKCVQSYGLLNADNGDIVLGGHSYLLQQEWSNRVNRCASS